MFLMDGRESGAMDAGEFRRVLVSLSTLLALAWLSHIVVGNEITRVAAGWMTGYFAGFVPLYGFLTRRRVRLRSVVAVGVVVAALLLWVAGVSFANYLSVYGGFEWLDPDGVFSEVLPGIPGGAILAVILMSLPHTRFSESEARRHRRGVLKAAGFMLGVLLGLLLLGFGAFVLIEYVVGPMVRNFA